MLFIVPGLHEACLHVTNSSTLQTDVQIRFLWQRARFPWTKTKKHIFEGFGGTEIIQQCMYNINLHKFLTRFTSLRELIPRTTGLDNLQNNFVQLL